MEVVSLVPTSSGCHSIHGDIRGTKEKLDAIDKQVETLLEFNKELLPRLSRFFNMYFTDPNLSESKLEARSIRQILLEHGVY